MGFVAAASFIIAIIGIVLQLADAFPEHRETRKTIVILSLGVFVGAGVSALLGARYEISGNIDAKYSLLFFFAFVALGFAAAGTMLKDKGRREFAATAAAASAGLFLLVGFAFALGSADPNRGLTDDNLILLASSAEQKSDYVAAIS
jgi:cytochrome bd-type quinol oxidase subunit 2